MSRPVHIGTIYRAFSNCRDAIYIIAFESRVDLNVLLDAEYQWPNIENVFAVLQHKFTGRELLRIYDYCIKHQYPRAPADGYHKGTGRPKKVGARVGNRNAAGAQKKARHVVVNNPRGKKEVVLK